MQLSMGDSANVFQRGRDKRKLNHFFIVGRHTDGLERLFYRNK